MKAYLMAAGLATRMRPLTEKFPKCLLRVEGVEMLEYWLNAVIANDKFDGIYVNVHHSAEMVKDFIDKYKKRSAKRFGEKAVKNIHIIDETSGLLGTAGTLFWHGDTSDDFFLAYVDTYSKTAFLNLAMMTDAWKDNPDNPLAGLLTFDLPEDKSAGAIETDFMGTITSFNEKSNSGLVAWAGMMFGRKEFFNHISQNDKDLARDVFPKLVGKLRVLAHIHAHDIGKGVDEYERFSRSIRSAS